MLTHKISVHAYGQGFIESVTLSYVKIYPNTLRVIADA